MVQYKLKYFPLRARAEVARQLFALGHQNYEDVRIPREDWPKYKPEAPFGQLPILEVDGKPLGQSYAINRYLARQFGFAGKTAFEEAKVDALADQWNDFFNEIRPYLMVAMGMTQGDKEKLQKEVFLPAVQKHFPFFIKALKESGSGFLVGSSVTWVDLQVCEFVSGLLAQEPTALQAFPQLKEHHDKVHAIPEIKKWIETRPATPY